MDLDSIDRQIIALLQEHGRRTNADIARLINVSESTVKNRINRLIDNGILRILAVLNPQVLGFHSDVLVGIRIAHAQGKLMEVGNALKAMNEVVYLGYITGRYDILIEVLLRDPDELFHFLRERLLEIPGIISTETFYVMRTEKINYEWGLPANSFNKGSSGNSAKKRARSQKIIRKRRR
ncbi:MAG: Lrp/AsnC family transcriptional regulator [Planctomycetota bacterium]|jgi:Lrp/AsnC family transcriptional regulator for asnA, asnC and gidA